MFTGNLSSIPAQPMATEDYGFVFCNITAWHMSPEPIKPVLFGQSTDKPVILNLGVKKTKKNNSVSMVKPVIFCGFW